MIQGYSLPKNLIVFYVRIFKMLISFHVLLQFSQEHYQKFPLAPPMAALAPGSAHARLSALEIFPQKN
jgi:hypothetical protein